MDNKKFQEMIDEFTLDSDAIKDVAASFRYDIEHGVKETGESSLRMLPSYIGLPTGKETGEYLALDFGGTNLRVVLIRLDGEGKFEVIKKVAKPLVVPGEYDFICADANADELFDFIADMIEEAVDGNRDKKYLLGHTFSFPSSQTNIYNARLIIWTKEFATKGVEGEVVNDLLKAALARKNLTNVEPTAVINDTVAVLLAAAYKLGNVNIGSIYATGHNTCYYETFTGMGKPAMVINMESGGFNKLAINKYDYKLDMESEKQYEQRLEKMVSGRYMGELLSYCLDDAWNIGKVEFTSIDISTILADNSDSLDEVCDLLKAKINADITTDDAIWVKALAETIASRSARLVVATYCGIMWHLYPNGGIPKQFVAVDGSVYEKMPTIKDNMQKAIYEILGEEADKLELVLENGGSALGAALAAAMEPVEC